MIRILRILAPNPSLMTLEGTNTWIVGGGPSLVIDPGPLDDGHLAEVEAAARGVAAVLLTHDHPDHAEAALAFAGRVDAPLHAARPPRGGERIRDGQTFRAEGVELVAVSTPGHSVDHVVFHEPTTGALFTGDAVLGRGTSVIDPPDGDLAAYLRSLRRMRDLAPRTIHPGHGPLVLRAVAKLDAYLEHRAERERAILALLAFGPSTPERLAREIYTDILPEARPLAERTVLAHLQKLQADGRVDRDPRDTWRAAEERTCARCGRPMRGRGRLCGACAVSNLQEPG